jgi:hypothetical protein
MKRNLYLILALLLLGVVQMRAQQMAVVTAEGTTEYTQRPYTSGKITFADGKMLFHHDGKVIGTHNIKDISRIYFFETRGIDAVQDKQPITYSPATEELHINASYGVVSVYQLNGTRVLSQPQTIATSTISVAHLPAGVYVATIGRETLKFVNQ